MRRMLSCRSIALIFTVFATVSSAELPPHEHAAPGEEAPRFYLPELGGGDFMLREWAAPEGQQLRPYLNRGRNAVVLSFFATWCIPCRTELPELQRLSKEYDGEPVIWRIVNVGDRPDSVRSFLAKLGVDLPVLLDRYAKVAEKYCGDPPAVPTSVVIAPDGVVARIEHGYDVLTMRRIAGALEEVTGLPAPEWTAADDSVGTAVEASLHLPMDEDSGGDK